MSTLFVGRILVDEQRVPSQTELLSTLAARGKLDGWVDLVEEGLEPDRARELLRSGEGKADLFARACASYSELFRQELPEAVEALRDSRLDARTDVKLFNLSTAWLMGSLLLPEAPKARCLRPGHRARRVSRVTSSPKRTAGGSSES